MKTLTYEKALLMFVQLKDNPTPTIVHIDAEWEDILETIDWLFGDRIIPLKKMCCPFSLRIRVLCYLVYLGFDCKSLANVLSLSPSTIVQIDGHTRFQALPFQYETDGFRSERV